eukprot:768128-Hanusia_phi.AAC.1
MARSCKGGVFMYGNRGSEREWGGEEMQGRRERGRGGEGYDMDEKLTPEATSFEVMPRKVKKE